MLTWEESLEAQALRQRGWTVAAIARHLERDPKTIRAYLNGDRVPGVRRQPGPDAFAAFVPYVRQRLVDDPHLWATTLYEELVELGYAGSYQSLTRVVRDRGLRPACADCAAAATRDRAIITHPPGDETQFDWVELPDPPASWALRGDAHLLVGSLAHSGRWRGVLAEAEDQPHLIEALAAVVGRLGGCTLAWRFDRMATVCHPGSGQVSASFAAVAKHYRVAVRICPPRRGRRKGVVEKNNHAAAQRWWRTLADEVTVAQAQAGLDGWCERTGDARTRRVDGARVTVAELAAAEPLQPAPAPYPAVLEVTRTVTDQALVAFRGNFYSVPPGLAGQPMTVRARLGDTHLELASAAGTVLARHPRHPDGAGGVFRDDGHVTALEKAVLAGSQATVGRCRHKARRPPSPQARAEAARLRGENTSSSDGEHVVIDLAPYAAALSTRRRAEQDEHRT